MLLPHARHALLLRELELRGSVRAREIAERTGVSEVTIRRDIVELEAAGRLVRVHGGAVPVREASRPAPARTLVGVLVPSDTPHFLEIVRGMEGAAEQLRVRPVLGVTHYRTAIEADRAQRLLDLGIAGLVVAPVVRGRSEAELEHWLTALPVPVVVLERHLGTSGLRGLDHVRTDHEHGAALAVEHLVGLGHRAVGLAMYEATPTARTVRRGWRDAVERLDLDEAPYAALPKGDVDPEELRSVLDRFLDACVAAGVRAVLVHTDQHAAQLVEVAQDRGLDVPGDLAVVAYDDNVADLAAVPLTAVTAPRRALGEQALRLLTERIAAPAGARVPRHIALLPHLAVRESCGTTA